MTAQEAEFEMDARQISACSIQEETPELYFCRDLKGYGWCFRKKNVLNVGLGDWIRTGSRGMSRSS